MGRLTWENEIGNWGLYDIPWENLRHGAVIDALTWNRLFSALRKLRDYENTGLGPGDIADLRMSWGDGFGDVVAALDKVKQALEGEQDGHRWIPVEERLPGDEGTLVLVQLSGRPDTNVTLIDSIELATYCEGGWILKGWFQWDEENPVAWMPLPKPYRPEKESDENGT